MSNIEIAKHTAEMLEWAYDMPRCPGGHRDNEALWETISNAVQWVFDDADEQMAAAIAATIAEATEEAGDEADLNDAGFWLDDPGFWLDVAERLGGQL